MGEGGEEEKGKGRRVVKQIRKTKSKNHRPKKVTSLLRFDTIFHLNIKHGKAVEATRTILIVLFCGQKFVQGKTI